MLSTPEQNCLDTKPLEKQNTGKRVNTLPATTATGQATSMLLGVAALVGNLGPAMVGILDPGHERRIEKTRADVISPRRDVDGC